MLQAHLVSLLQGIENSVILISSPASRTGAVHTTDFKTVP